MSDRKSGARCANAKPGSGSDKKPLQPPQSPLRHCFSTVRRPAAVAVKFAVAVVFVKSSSKAKDQVAAVWCVSADEMRERRLVGVQVGPGPVLVYPSAASYQCGDGRGRKNPKLLGAFARTTSRRSEAATIFVLPSVCRIVIDLSFQACRVLALGSFLTRD